MPNAIYRHKLTFVTDIRARWKRLEEYLENRGQTILDRHGKSTDNLGLLCTGLGKKSGSKQPQHLVATFLKLILDGYDSAFDALGSRCFSDGR